MEQPVFGQRRKVVKVVDRDVKFVTKHALNCLIQHLQDLVQVQLALLVALNEPPLLRCAVVAVGLQLHVLPNP